MIDILWRSPILRALMLLLTTVAGLSTAVALYISVTVSLEVREQARKLEEVSTYNCVTNSSQDHELLKLVRASYRIQTPQAQKTFNEFIRTIKARPGCPNGKESE